VLRELGQIGAQLVTDTPEQREAFFLGAVERRRVFKVVMQPLRPAKEHGTGLAGADVIDALTAYFSQEQENVALLAADKTFAVWDNEDDRVYDTL
jgi:hypothetical protein